MDGAAHARPLQFFKRPRKTARNERHVVVYSLCSSFLARNIYFTRFSNRVTFVRVALHFRISSATEARIPIERTRRNDVKIYIIATNLSPVVINELIEFRGNRASHYMSLKHMHTRHAYVPPNSASNFKFVSRAKSVPAR